MSNARVIRRPPAATNGNSKSSSGGKGKWIAAVVLLLLLAGIGYALMPAGRDPGLARIDDLHSQMEGASSEQRRELWGQMRQEMEGLSPEARESMRQEWSDRREQREQQYLNEFFALSPQDQVKRLDQELRDEAKRRKEREQRAGGRPDRGGRGFGGPGGPGGNRTRSTSDDPNARRRSYLDNSTPEARAMRSEYRTMREERRKRLGL